MHITTRISGRKHEDLLMEKGGTGTPYFAIIDAEGNVLGKPLWPFQPSMLRESIALVRRWQDLRAKGEAGDAVAATDAMLVACELGQVEYDDLDIDEEALTDAQKAKYGQLGIDSDVATLSASLRGSGGDEAKVKGIVRDLVAIRDGGGRPGPPELKHFFWQVLARKAIEENDSAALEAAISDLKTTPGLEQMAQGLEAKLAEMRASKEKGTK